MGCLYMLTAPTGKRYIGISKKTAAERFENHVKHLALGRRNAIHRALMKYGPGTFTVTTLLIAEDLQYLRWIEAAAIKAFGTFAPSGYNMTHGGEGSAFWAPESLAKARIGQRAAWKRDYEKRKAASVVAIAAMARATQDPAVEKLRRERISSTMKSVGMNRGSTNKMAKLTEDSVRQIKALIPFGTNAAIAKQFQVSAALIGLIRGGQRWAHI